MSPRSIAHRRALLLAACLAGGLGLPPAASAMPIDNGPAPQTTPGAQPPAPEVRTVIREDGQPLAIVLGGAALVVALTSAGYSAVRLSALRPARPEQDEIRVSATA
jgi:hypothetical protein